VLCENQIAKISIRSKKEIAKGLVPESEGTQSMVVKVPHENNEDPNLQKTQCHYLLIEDQSERLTEKEERRTFNMKDHLT
jgi:hypothetical protein